MKKPDNRIRRFRGGGAVGAPGAASASSRPYAATMRPTGLNKGGPVGRNVKRPVKEKR